MGNGITEEELSAFHRTVGRLRRLPADDPVRLQTEEHVAASFVRDGQARRRRARNEAASAADAATMAATATGAPHRREDAPLVAPGRPGFFHKARRCYVCKSACRQVDGFHHRLCPGCAVDNRARRTLATDLTGRRALLTGGRVEIGFQLALMLLRAGVELIVTSRFPHDTARRFRAEPDCAKWLDRLHILASTCATPARCWG